MPSKSFRVAAERIVRQESASPTDVLSLLGSPTEPWRAIASEIDEWDARLGALRVIGEYDALAVVASKPVWLTHAHNVSEGVALEDAVVKAGEEPCAPAVGSTPRTPPVRRPSARCWHWR